MEITVCKNTESMPNFSTILAMPNIKQSPYPHILEPHSACFWCPFCRFSLCALHLGPLKSKEKSHTMIKGKSNSRNFHFSTSYLLIIFPVKALCSIIFSFVFNDQIFVPHFWQAMLVRAITSEHGGVQGNTYTCIMLLKYMYMYTICRFTKNCSMNM